MVTLLVGTLGLDITVLPSRPTFRDVPSTHWAYPYVEAAYREGIIKGISSDLFGVDLNSTREQIAVMLVNAFGLTNTEVSLAANQSRHPEFEDIQHISNWAHDQVVFGQKYGLIMGDTQGKFNPKSSATKQDVAVMLTRFLDHQVQILNAFEVAQWAQVNGSNRLMFTFHKPIRSIEILEIVDAQGRTVADQFRGKYRSYIDWGIHYKRAEVTLIEIPIPLEMGGNYTVKYAFTLREENGKTAYGEKQFTALSGSHVQSVSILNGTDVFVWFRDLGLSQSYLENPQYYLIVDENNNIIPIQQVVATYGGTLLKTATPMNSNQKFFVTVGDRLTENPPVPVYTTVVFLEASQQPNIVR